MIFYTTCVICPLNIEQISGIVQIIRLLPLATAFSIAERMCNTSPPACLPTNRSIARTRSNDKKDVTPTGHVFLYTEE